MSEPPAVPDPDALVAATLACPSVSAMSGGVLGGVATYLPGRRVPGIRTRPDGIEVHVVGVFGPSIGEIVSQVREAVEPLMQGHQLSVHVADLAVDLADLAVDLAEPAARQVEPVPVASVTVPEPRHPPSDSLR